MALPRPGMNYVNSCRVECTHLMLLALQEIVLRIYLDTTSRLTASGKRKHWKTTELLDCIIAKAQKECTRVLTPRSNRGRLV